ncbi:MAG: GDSL-type esterase/lipase family protein [Verrucomicrobiota bacterium]
MKKRSHGGIFSFAAGKWRFFAKMRRRDFSRTTAGTLAAGILLSGCRKGGRWATPYPDAIRVACEGDSITFGHKVKDRVLNCYPGRLQSILGREYHIKNYGINGATLITRGDYPYMYSKEFEEALAFEPRIVVLMLGTNDVKPWNLKKTDDFVEDGVALIERHTMAEKTFVCFPTPVFPEAFGVNGAALESGIIPLLEEVAQETRSTVVDLHTPFLDRAELFPDKLHPSREACEEMAKIVADAILSAPVERDAVLESDAAPSENIKRTPDREIDVTSA